MVKFECEELGIKQNSRTKIKSLIILISVFLTKGLVVSFNHCEINIVRTYMRRVSSSILIAFNPLLDLCY